MTVLAGAGARGLPPDAWSRPFLFLAIGALLGTAVCFRLLYLSSMPGISGDEGWWGMQALSWLAGRPYEAQTTSGNPTDLFFLIPVAFAQLIGPPSFVLLRLVPALVNLAALPIGFWFVRRIYGDATAWIHTVMLAILPTAIAHSRICQDPSQSVFWTGLVVYCSLLALEVRANRWPLVGVALLLFPVALWTHPTNIFVAPFLLLPFATASYARLAVSRRARALLLGALAMVIVLGVAAAGPASEYLLLWSPALNKPWLPMAAARAADPAQWLELAANTARLFNGVTVYKYFSGALPLTILHDLGFLVVAGAAFGGFLVRPAASRRLSDAALVGACAGTWLLFFLFAGPGALRPHAERWGLCLLVPGSLALSRGLSAWIEGPARTRRVAIVAASLVGMLVLASFYLNYFREFATTGGRSHLTYVTAPTEPKRQAFEHILAVSRGSDPVMIVTQQWWLFWPIAYLASAYPHIVVESRPAEESQPRVQESLRNERFFLVEFAGTPELHAALAWIEARQLRVVRTTISDAGGRAHVEVLQVTPRQMP
jgi:hypothetical protein